MDEVWKESAKFYTTTQRLTDQARIISKKGWSYDREILEISAKVSREKNTQLEFPKGAETETL